MKSTDGDASLYIHSTKQIQACFGWLSALEIKSCSKFRSQVTDKHSKMLRLWQSLISAGKVRWEIGFLETKEVMNAERKMWIGDSKKGTLNLASWWIASLDYTSRVSEMLHSMRDMGKTKPKGWGMSPAAIWAWRNWKTGSQEGMGSFWALQRT